MARKVSDPIIGDLTILGFPQIHGLCFATDIHPALGQHGDQLLSEYLGFTGSQIADLYSKGILFAANR